MITHNTIKELEQIDTEIMVEDYMFMDGLTPEPEYLERLRILFDKREMLVSLVTKTFVIYGAKV